MRLELVHKILTEHGHFRAKPVTENKQNQLKASEWVFKRHNIELTHGHQGFYAFMWDVRKQFKIHLCMDGWFRPSTVATNTVKERRYKFTNRDERLSILRISQDLGFPISR